MIDFATETDWQIALRNGRPFLDVRAPLEFAAGAVPGATNIPILDDDERHQVGICYKQKGPEAAFELGHAVVSGETKRARVEKWVDFARRHTDAHLYCFRGGQRSE